MAWVSKGAAAGPQAEDQAAPSTAYRRGVILAAASAVCYGALGVLAKLAYAEGWNVPTLLSARFLLAGLTVLPFALRRGGSWRGAGAAFLVGAVGYATTTAFYFPAIALLHPGVAAFLLYLAPPIVALLGWLLFRERVGWVALAAMGLALAGLALLGAGALRGSLPWSGVLLGALAGVAFGCTVVASRHAVRDLAWPRATLAISAGAFASYLSYSLVSGSLHVPASVPGYLYVLGIGTLATGVALSLFMAALQRIGASRTALISTLEPVSTLAIAAFVFTDFPDAWALAGGALILVAAALVATEKGEELAAGRE